MEGAMKVWDQVEVKQELIDDSMFSWSCEGKIPQLDLKLETKNEVELSENSEATEIEASKSQVNEQLHEPTQAESFMSEGHCAEHNIYRGLRCMTCSKWICGMCGVLHHKLCRTLLVAEAYQELKMQMCLKAAREIGEKKALSEKRKFSLKDLGVRRLGLIEELNNCEKQIAELESQELVDHKFCEKLYMLQTMVAESEGGDEFSKAQNDLNHFIYLERKKKILEKLGPEGAESDPIAFKKFLRIQRNRDYRIRKKLRRNTMITQIEFNFEDFEPKEEPIENKLKSEKLPLEGTSELADKTLDGR